MKFRVGYFIVLVVMMALTVGVCYVVFTNKINFKKIKLGVRESKTLVLDKEYDNVYDKIIIESTASNIEVKNTDSDKIKVNVYSEKNNVNVNTTDNTLKVKDNTKPCKRICLGFKITKIVLEVPTSYDKQIVLNDSFGNIKVESVSDLKIIEGFGNITIDSVNNLDLHNSFGDSKIGKVTNCVKLHNDFGDIKINSLVANLESKIDTDFGDIKIETATINANSSIETNFGDIRIKDINDVKVNAKTSFGDVDNNTKSESEIILNANTDFGDVKIK